MGFGVYWAFARFRVQGNRIVTTIQFDCPGLFMVMSSGFLHILYLQLGHLDLS